ncbi:MAG: ATP-binding protein [Bacteroidales bacterium]
MKNFIINFKFLIVAIILILIATLIEQNTLQPENYQVDTGKFREILFHKEKTLEDILLKSKEKIKPLLQKNNIDLFETFSDMDFKNLEKQGFVMLVYINDSLKYWTSNSLELNKLYSGSKLNNIVVKLNNAWYYIKNIHDKNLEIIGLILIKHDYSYENEYLVNSFHKDFGLPNSIQISMVPLSYSFDIDDKDNQYLFSLVPKNTIYSKNESWDFTGLIYFIGIAFLFLFFNGWFRQISVSHANPDKRMILILIFLLFLRYLMLEFKYPLQLYSMSFFDPGYFAVSYLFPSLGDFLINSLIILFFTRSAFYFLRSGYIIRYFRKKTQFTRLFFSVLSLFLIVLFFNLIIQLLESLVMNSSLPLEAHRILELNLFSLLAYSIFGILLSSIVIVTDRIIFINRHILVQKQFFSTAVIVLLVYSIVVFSFGLKQSSESLIYLMALFTVITYIHFGRKKYHYSFYILLIIIGSAYITLFINNTIKQKDEGKARVVLSRLVNERDMIAEHLLFNIDQDIKTDTILKSLILKSGSNYEQINEQLKNKYFTGYFSKFDLDLVVCCDCEMIPQSNKLKNCTKYWGEMIERFGEKIENTEFYYLDNHTGRVSYLGSVNYKSQIDNSTHILWIKLDSKLFTQEVGYPDLLIDGKINNKSTWSDYSYAKYQNGQLITKSGNFPYDLSDKMFNTSSTEYYYLNIGDYHHTINKSDKNLVVLSRTRVKSFDLVIAFSYIFVFFNILLIITLLINNTPQLWQQIQLNFENKLLMAMLFVLGLSFAMITAGTVYYNTNQFEKKHNTNISEKLESVLKNLEFEENAGKLIETKDTLIDLSEILNQFSSIYYTDINLYNNQGELLASSRPEVFSLGLVGSYMDPEALSQMKNNEKIRFIQDEKIGQMQFTSAYALFRRTGGKTPLYINLPYFTKPVELRKEISNLVVAVINLYVVLFIVVALVSFFMANKITQPLRMLQSRFQKIELGKQSERIYYNKKDEVGALVEEYNRMVIKLAESIDLLAKTERESAWREMAKQIAHEIKNPLTPMKLSVQFLQRSWQDKDANFEVKLGKYTQTLIDQINTLSNIATEFSSFAKMPKANPEVVDLVVRIEFTVNLFINTENVKIETNIDQFDKLLIIADHEQISRVLTNLTKNAIQAVPSEKNGYIRIMAEKEKNYVVIKVTDNGSGITEDQKEKLFMPSFTTKTSGMGMGLPIVKDIVESAGGKIWFETELNKGTTFFIRFPLASKEQIEEYSSVKIQNDLN